jgi:hypothetical protein
MKRVAHDRLNGEIPLNHPPQPHYRQPHSWGLSYLLEFISPCTPEDAPEALFFDQIGESNKIIFVSELAHRLLLNGCGESTRYAEEFIYT